MLHTRQDHRITLLISHRLSFLEEKYSGNKLINLISARSNSTIILFLPIFTEELLTVISFDSERLLISLFLNFSIANVYMV